MDQSTIDSIILDETRLKHFLLTEINDSHRPLFYQRCIQIRHHQSINPSTKLTNQSINQLIKPLDLNAYDKYCMSLFGHINPPINLPCVPDFGSPIQFYHSDHLSSPINQATNPATNPATANQPTNQSTNQSINQSLESLLCLIKEAHPDLPHCPYLADLIILLKRYFTDQSIFALIRLMITAINPSINVSNNPSINQSFYFTLTGQSFIVFLKKFYLLFKSINESMKHRLKHMGIDISIEFGCWVERLYREFHAPTNQSTHQSINQSINQSLNGGLSTVYRFLDGFMAYGQPWLWTWTLSLFELHNASINQCTLVNHVSLVFFGEMCESSGDDVIEIGLQLLPKIKKYAQNINQRSIDRYVIKTTHMARETSNHVPTTSINQSSEILTHDHFCAIWCWLIDSLKVANPELLYASSRHGYSLSTLLSKCTTDVPGDHHQPTITVVKTSMGAIFGVYLSHSWVRDTDAINIRKASMINRTTMNEREMKIEEETMQSRISRADNESFVFMLSPEMKCFRPSQARFERKQKVRKLKEQFNSRRVLRARRDGLHSRDSRVTSAIDHTGDESIDEISIIEQLDNNQTINNINQSNSNTVTFRAPISPMAAERGLAAQLMQLLQEHADGTDDKHAQMICSSDEILIGDGHGVAFMLDKNLKRGVTQRTTVFANECLAPGLPRDGVFDVSAVEVWRFKAPHE